MTAIIQSCLVKRGSEDDLLPARDRSDSDREVERRPEQAWLPAALDEVRISLGTDGATEPGSPSLLDRRSRG